MRRGIDKSKTDMISRICSCMFAQVDRSNNPSTQSKNNDWLVNLLQEIRAQDFQ